MNISNKLVTLFEPHNGLYIPGRSVVNIEYETLVKLAKLENVKARNTPQ